MIFVSTVSFIDLKDKTITNEYCTFKKYPTTMKTLLQLAIIFMPYAIYSQCFISYISANIGACDPNDNLFDITGEIQFSSPPVSGQLIVEDCNGNQVVFNAPFTSPQLYSIPDLPSNGTSNCDVTAYFTANVGCSITSLSFNYPTTCVCSVDAGTYTETINGNSNTGGILTWGDQLVISSNGDAILHDSVPGLSYAPGLGYLVYTCPPTLSNLPTADTCIFGIAGFGNTFIETNNVGSIYQTIPSQQISNNTLYYVPITFYDTLNGQFAVSINGGPWCYDYGSVFPIMYLDSISCSISPNPGNGSVDFVLSGAYPLVNGSSFTISNILPVNAVPSQTTVLNNGGFTLSGLTNGQNYSFTITDDVGSVKNIGGYYASVNEFVGNHYTVYPNPTSGNLKITTANHVDQISVNVQNALGQNILSKVFTSGQQFSFDIPYKGVYFLDVTIDGKHTHSKKVIVK